ncbi:hypothetical protein L9F63_021219, partial [Diploptera punctata]
KYSGPATFSPQDEVIIEEREISNQAASRPRRSIVNVSRFGVWRKKEQKIRKIERILRGSNCGQLICRAYDIIPKGVMQRLLRLEEERMCALEEIRTAAASMAQSEEIMAKTMKETNEVMKNMESLIENIVRNDDKIVTLQTHF